MGSQDHSMVMLGLQTRNSSATSHVAAMVFAQISHALRLNNICDCLLSHEGIPCTDPESCSVGQEYSGQCPVFLSSYGIAEKTCFFPGFAVFHGTNFNDSVVYISCSGNIGVFG